MKAFSSEQIQELNRLSTSGIFVEACIFTRDQSDPNSAKDYLVHYGKYVVFRNHVYQPIDMAWSGLKVSAGMELPTNEVVIADVGGVVTDYLEDPSIVMEGNDCWLQVLHIDKFGGITLVDAMLYTVELITAEYGKGVTFHLGVNFSLNDTIPRETIEKQEFPGIKDDAIRVGT